jgi:lycopene cyclase domain-containing protein
MSYYGYILLFSFLGPLSLSFDRKVAYFKRIPRLILPLLFVSGMFIVWDQWFTAMGVWGFNKEYIAGCFLGQLPLEEVLFFVIVPYNCIFIYEVVGAYFQPKFSRKFNFIFLGLFIALGIILWVKNPFGWYPVTAVTFALILSVYFMARPPQWLSQALISYLVCLIPFLVVNGLLTGAASPRPVVWYNAQEFSNWRIITIPFEDLYYNFDLFIGFVAFYHLPFPTFRKQ